MKITMKYSLRKLVLAATLAVISAPTASAQKPEPKIEKVKVDGKVSIIRLFNDAIATARGSTVSLRYNSKSVTLGTVVTKDGHILTKGSDLIFAMKKPAEEDGGLIVRLQDGSRHAATVVGYHEPTDIAMVKIDAKDLAPVKFVDSKLAEAGNMVAAPGMESEAVAAGIISAGVRKLYREEAIIDNGNKGYLGIILDTSRDDAVIIKEMEDTSPAKKAKLLIGDQIVSVDNRTVVNFDDLKKILGGFKPGDKVTVLVKRKPKDKDDEETLSFDVKLGAKSAFDRSAFQNSMGSELSGRRTGFPMVITHDMVLEPKDCGGPLVDLEGRVLGINIARAGRVESWALPPEVVKPIITELKDGKHPLKQ